MLHGEGAQVERYASRRDWLGTAREVFVVSHILRMPILCTALTVLILTVPQQTPEVIRAIVQNVLFYWRELSGQNWRDALWPIVEAGCAIVGLFVLILGQWWINSQLVLARGKEVSPSSRWIFDYAQRILVLAVFAAAFYAILMARTKVPKYAAADAVMEQIKIYFPGASKNTDSARAYAQGIKDLLFSYNVVLLWAAVVTAALAVAMVLALPATRSADQSVDAAGRRTLLGPTFSALVFSTIVGLIIALYRWPVAIPQSIGALAVIFLFLVCLNAVLAQLSHTSDRRGLPIILLIVIWVFMLSAFNLNDNHEIYRTLATADEGSTSAALPPNPRDLRAAFSAWWKARGALDYAKYKETGKPYPIYVAAAEGGGSYAAMHAASILGGLQDACPGFAHHLFAISGVSGGSVGAATFAGLLKQTESAGLKEGLTKPCRGEGWLPDNEHMVGLADNLLSTDLLAPLVSGLLFPDFVQRFIPFPISDFDRARWLERAFEQAMDETIDYLATTSRADNKGERRNFLATRYVDHWRPEGSIPALVLNTTEVGSGRRRVISPFVFAPESLLTVPFWDDFKAYPQADRIRDLPVSTAAMLSARFPWATPAGTLRDFDRDLAKGSPKSKDKVRKFRLVDGGYFENSGVATAVDMIREMEDVAKAEGFAHEIRIRLIVLISGTYPDQTFYGLGEAISPVQTLLQTRTSRAYITIADAERVLHAPLPPPAEKAVEHHLQKVTLQNLGYELPLGWRLSPILIMLIRAQNGMPGHCRPKPPGSGRAGRFDVDDADCLLEDVASELKY
jgi:hypothetical protein